MQDTKPPTKRIEKPIKGTSTSDMLEGIVQDQKQDTLSLFEIANSVSERGFGLLVLFFALPACIPVYIPFFPSICAIPIMFFSVQMMAGKTRPWIPKWIGKKEISRKTLSMLITKSTPLLRKVEKVIRPRLRGLLDLDISDIIIGLFMLIFAISVTVPLPLTNFLPGVGIALISLGLLSRDGLMVIIGIITGIVGVAFTSLLLIMGKKAVLAMLGLL